MKQKTPDARYRDAGVNEAITVVDNGTLEVSRSQARATTGAPAYKLVR